MSHYSAIPLEVSPSSLEQLIALHTAAKSDEVFERQRLLYRIPLLEMAGVVKCSFHLAYDHREPILDQFITKIAMPKTMVQFINNEIMIEELAGPIAKVIQYSFVKKLEYLLQGCRIMHPMIKQLVHEDDVLAMAFSPDSERIVTGCNDGIARVWNANTGELLLELIGHDDMIWSVCFTRDGTRVITGSADETGKIWNSITGELVHTLEGHQEVVQFVLADPDGSNVIAIDENSIKIWQQKDGQLLHMTSLETFVDVTWIPEDGILMTNDVFGLSCMRDIKTGAPRSLDFNKGQKGFKGQLDFLYKRFAQIKSWHEKSEGGVRLLTPERALTHSRN